MFELKLREMTEATVIARRLVAFKIQGFQCEIVLIIILVFDVTSNS